MSLSIIILIMLLAGFVGGAINFLLPSNTGEDKLQIRSILNCVAMGVGATKMGGFLLFPVIKYPGSRKREFRVGVKLNNHGKKIGIVYRDQ